MSEYSGFFELIGELSALRGTSGDEGAVRDLIRSRIPRGCTVTVDSIGNLLVFTKGEKTPGSRIMYCAHMDEVGFIVTDITGDGLLKFAPVGGISPSVVFGRRLVSGSGITGVVAAKPIHHLSSDEKDNQPKISDLAIDIGAENAGEAEKAVSRGDLFYFTGGCDEFGDGFIRGKALDDRVGCAVMLEMMNTGLAYDTYFAFTVQEEIGTRGAECAAFNVRPDIAVILETTTACDIAGSEGEKAVCRLGDGVVISFMDRMTIYDRELYKLARNTADDIGVRHQTKTMIAGGNDGGAVHKAVGGVRTVNLSVPTRYLHSPSCVMKKDDAIACLETAKALLERLGNIKSGI